MFNVGDKVLDLIDNRVTTIRAVGRKGYKLAFNHLTDPMTGTGTWRNPKDLRTCEDTTYALRLYSLSGELVLAQPAPSDIKVFGVLKHGSEYYVYAGMKSGELTFKQVEMLEILRCEDTAGESAR